jgi:hypothetical protein
MAHVCRDPMTKKISSIKFLDLYRAEVQFKGRLLVQRTNAPYKEQLESGVRSIAHGHWKVYDQMNLVREDSDNVRFVNFELPSTKDGFEQGDTLEPEEGCAFEQLAIFTQGGTLLIRRELYDALPMTDKAAFYSHELLLRVVKMFDDSAHPEVYNSVPVQRTVGLLFSKLIGSWTPRTKLQLITKSVSLALAHALTLSDSHVRHIDYIGMRCRPFEPFQIDSMGSPVRAVVAGRFTPFVLKMWLKGSTDEKDVIVIAMRERKDVTFGDDYFTEIELPVPPTLLNEAKIELVPDYEAPPSYIPPVELKLVQGDRVISRAENVSCESRPGTRVPINVSITIK